MNMNQFYTLMYILLVTSTLSAISSTNWMFMWLAMEINMLCFIPMMFMSSQYQETEAGVKYFLNQALGSSMLLMSSMMLTFNFPFSYISHTILTMSLMLKLGAAPFHLWYPSVMASISWMNCMTLSTWQKLAPLYYVTMIMSKSMTSLLILFASINALVGGLMGMNQTKLRTILAYSSITHLGWMLALSLFKPLYSMLYLIMYSLIISPLFMLMYFTSIFQISSSSLTNMHPLINILVPLLLLSTSGMPPMTGFILKWFSISLMINKLNSMFILSLLIGSMMSTYYYLTMMFNATMSFETTAIHSNKNTLNIMLMSLMLIALFMLPMLMSFFSFNLFMFNNT